MLTRHQLNVKGTSVDFNPCMVVFSTLFLFQQAFVSIRIRFFHGIRKKEQN